MKSAGENKIKFGTDGWRGIIAKDFTFENVSRVAQAIADYHKSTSNWSKGLAVGYDTRFLSSEFATLMAEVLSGNQIPVILSHSDVPTQCISFTVKRRKLAGGVMITASHNPPPDNGLKFWNPDGSSFGSEQMEEMENLLLNNESRTKPWDAVGTAQNIDWPIERHISSVIEQIGHLDSKVVVDCGNGVTSGITPYVLRRLGCEVITLNANPDGSFPGRSSEPTEENTRILAKCVVDSGADIGIAHDGDGDRMVAVD